MALREISYNNKTFSINYEIINPNKTIDLIILHGWGSNKEIMKQAFSKTLKDFRHIYIDMPGFGKSSNDSILTTSDYSHIIDLLLNDLKSNKELIMGHSFGGKVATLLNPKTLILLSSAGVVIPKSFKVRSKIKLFKLLKLLGFKKLRSLFASKDVEGMSHEMYETFKNVVDEDFTKVFQSFQGKAVLFWGKSDTATPPSSAEKIVTLIPDSTLYLLDGDHYFFLKQAPFIEEKIIGL